MLWKVHKLSGKPNFKKASGPRARVIVCDYTFSLFQCSGCFLLPPPPSSYCVGINYDRTVCLSIYILEYIHQSTPNHVTNSNMHYIHNLACHSSLPHSLTPSFISSTRSLPLPPSLPPSIPFRLKVSVQSRGLPISLE